MEVYYDLHIHSALSPCADNDMTPNNIINMALLIGLDMIAITDHNSTANVAVAAKLAKQAGICFIPGIEVTTAEEVHILAFFYDVDAAIVFGDKVYASLPEIDNEPSFFGQQLVIDEEDERVKEKRKLLISATPYELNECCAMISEHGGVCVPAHVNKESNSILANLGFFPADLFFPTIEVTKGGRPVQKEDSRFIHNSDAHTLGDISERENCMKIEELSRKSMLHKLNSRMMMQK